jgi:uncharacterized glyoxalase superfamily protein PhnB
MICVPPAPRLRLAGVQAKEEIHRCATSTRPAASTLRPWIPTGTSSPSTMVGNESESLGGPGRVRWQHRTITLGRSPMPGLPSSNPAQFVQGAPVLHVSDVQAAAAYYRDVLGFTSDFGDETYAVVWRDNSAIHFVKDAGAPRGVHLFQWVRDVDAYFREIRGRGAAVASEPADRPYGIREFGVRDLNGVDIVFGQDLEHE